MRVQQLTKSGDFIREFASESEAASELGLTSTLIKWVCEGKRKQHGGFAWRYVEDGTRGEFEASSDESSVTTTLTCIDDSGLMFRPSGLEDYTVPRPVYIIFYHAGFSSKPLDHFYLSLDNAISQVRSLLSEDELKDNDSLERNHINKYRYYLKNSNYYEIVNLVEGDSLWQK